ncbi:MAG: hypothetical protein QM704_25410 [Anaeromyxobacteraceae bacterium]
MMSKTWTLVIAHTAEVGVRVLLLEAALAADFGRWLRASGWHVRFEDTTARSPYELRRTKDEEDLAGGLASAYSQWARVARPSLALADLGRHG